MKNFARLLLFLAALAQCCPARAEIPELPARLRELDATVVPAGGARLTRMIADDVSRRTIEAAARETQVWNALKTRADWEAFRDVRIKALRDSLGPFPDVPANMDIRVTGRIEADGYTIQDLVYETRPGLFVTANLYLPAKASLPGGMPGVLLSHSHHAPKTEGELQDMGIMWARLGCAVLVSDHLGHGERRQHPFINADSYPGSFKVGRQDYYFRYNAALQLNLVGQSVMGWMVWDLMRGVDVLLRQPGIDREKIILIGSVAGGGDPAAVTAALDHRIAAVAPFNFGGPQPDDPIPANAQRDFLYFGSPWWESTRCLRLDARDGFAQWLIVASIAPRRLIYSCEFAWDHDRDPVWPRVAQVFDWYGAADHLATAQGRGSLKGRPPESSHCNNVGPVQRAQLYPTLEKWFGIAPPPKETESHRRAEELNCLTPRVLETVKPRRVFELAADIGAARAAAARDRLSKLQPQERGESLRADWSRLLGNVDPAAPAKVTERRQERLAGIQVERMALEVEPDIVVPLMVLIPGHPRDSRLAAVVAFAEAGKQQFLRQRAQAISALLDGGIAVVLPDLRGTGETALPDHDRDRGGEGTSVSQAELMLGQTLLGQRLRDLRSVLGYLRTRGDIDPARLMLWGDSFAPANPPGTRLEVPLDADKSPAISEPLGGSLVLLGMLFEPEVRAGYARGGLACFQSCLQSPFCYFPHDAVVPGALTAGDLADIAAAIAPRPLRLAGLVDGLNRRVDAQAAAQAFDAAFPAYRAAGATDHFVIEEDNQGTGDGTGAARWMLRNVTPP